MVILHDRSWRVPRVAAYLSSPPRLALDEQGIFRPYSELEEGMDTKPLLKVYAGIQSFTLKYWSITATRFVFDLARLPSQQRSCKFKSTKSLEGAADRLSPDAGSC